MVIDQALDPCSGYMVCLVQKVGRKQAYKNSLITTLLSGEQRTATAGALLYALFWNGCTKEPAQGDRMMKLER
jgi:hypothetical protein